VISSVIRDRSGEIEEQAGIKERSAAIDRHIFSVYEVLKMKDVLK
jgi:hypothetical protein